ncbi:MAG: arabinose efflux permease family protein [Firmicutes bacterium]|nr:arabinose efflux permease family protein [Bacillota bacterium]
MTKIFRNMNLVIFLFGYFISGIGSSLTTIALASKVYQLMNNNLSVSIVFLLPGIPTMLLGNLGGSFVDKLDKKLLFITLNLLFAITSSLMACVSHIYILFMLVFITGILNAFLIPLKSSLIPLLVEKAELAEANGVRASTNGIITILGYALGGTMTSYLGSTVSLLADSISFIFIALLFIFVKLKRVEAENVEAATLHRISEVKEGWVFIKKHPIIRNVFSLDVLTNFIIAMQLPLTYIFVKDYLGGEVLMAERTGLLFSSSGIGVLVGGILIAHCRRMNKVTLLSLSLIIDGIVVLAFSVNRIFYISLFIFGVMGILGAFVGTILEIVIQENTPQKLMGRVFGCINSVIGPIGMISIFVGGIVTEFIEVKWVFLIGAVIEFFVGVYFLNRIKLGLE